MPNVHLNKKKYEKAQDALSQGINLVKFFCIKLIRITDKSECGWQTGRDFIIQSIELKEKFARTDLWSTCPRQVPVNRITVLGKLRDLTRYI